MTGDRERERFAREVGRKAERRLRARRGDHDPLPTGSGSLGTVGWSIVLPTLAGLAVGVWLETVVGGVVPWTVVGLAGGVAVGAVTAWRWLTTGSGGGAP